MDEESGIRAHLKRADYTPSELRQEWQNSLALRKPGKGSTGRLLDELDLRSCSTNTGSEHRDAPAGLGMGGGAGFLPNLSRRLWSDRSEQARRLWTLPVERLFLRLHFADETAYLLIFIES